MNEGLALEDIRAGYGKAEVIRGLSLRIGRHETVAVLGPNGSGKSTVAKTIMGLTSLYQGWIQWDGQDITDMPTWKRASTGLGYVPQLENVFPSLTVDENLRLAAMQLSKPDLARRLAEVYERYPMLKCRDCVVASSLSGGERRLLALATTILQDPRLLILDEPTSDLAPAAIDIVFDKIREIRDDLQLPLLLIEQNVERALELADRVCILIQGCIVADRPAEKISPDEIGRIFLDKINVPERALTGRGSLAARIRG